MQVILLSVSVGFLGLWGVGHVLPGLGTTLGAVNLVAPDAAAVSVFLALIVGPDREHAALSPD